LDGFRRIRDYYEKASSCRYLFRINVPTLLVPTLDDPFMVLRVVSHNSEFLNTKAVFVPVASPLGLVSGPFPVKG
jgi:predicted alpha/beta-fold hydrolase